MNTTFKMFRNMVKQITREMMMVMLVIAPLLIGMFLKIGIPLLESKLLVHYGMEEILIPYYELFSWLFAMVIGILFAFVGGLVVLGEIDENVTRYLIVTPVGIRGYLFSRIGIPALLSGMVAFLLIPVVSLCKIDIITLAVMVVSNTLSGIVTAFLVVAVSTNKVEGMAVGKLAGLFGATFFIPLLIKGWVKYIFCLFPMYYVGKWSLEGGALNLVLSCILFVGWIGGLYLRFQRKCK